MLADCSERPLQALETQTQPVVHTVQDKVEKFLTEFHVHCGE